MSDEKIAIKELSKEALLWEFDPHASFDKPFHALVAAYGIEAIMSLDALVLEDTRNAARNAVKFHREKLIESGLDDVVVRAQSMSLAKSLGVALKNERVTVSHEPLLPKEAVYPPPARPSM